jgi:hypothetical protein
MIPTEDISQEVIREIIDEWHDIPVHLRPSLVEYLGLSNENNDS